MKDAGLREAIKAAGSGKALAERLGITPAAIGLWRQVPTDRVLAVEAATGVPRHKLRPDIFGSLPNQRGFSEVQTPFATEARALGLDPDAIAAQAIAEAIRTEKARRWQEENREAMEAWNDWTEQNGLPLAKYRMF